MHSACGFKVLEGLRPHFVDGRFIMIQCRIPDTVRFESGSSESSGDVFDRCCALAAIYALFESHRPAVAIRAQKPFEGNQM
jgi:hypothetical protein